MAVSIPSLQPPKTPRSASSLKLSIGDKVTLPDGQSAILRYIGPIQGKDGEFAGVELTGDFVSMGKHSGTYEG